MDKFNLESNGYNKEEVNRFVDNVIKQTEDIVNNYKLKSTEVSRLKLELEHYRRIEKSLNVALEDVKSVKERATANAEKEAKIIIVDAKNNASRIVNEALLKAERINVDLQRMQNNIKILKRRLKLILEQQQEIVEEIEVLELDNN